MGKTVVNLDLVGYSDTARLLDEQAGPRAVDLLNQQIEGFVDLAIGRAKLPAEPHHREGKGDSALLVFDRPVDAHKFAVAFFGVVGQHNARLREPGAKRLFRMGAATGEIAVRQLMQRQVAGTAIIDAVRLEAAGQPGMLLVDKATFGALPRRVRELYADAGAVAGKREESIAAHRCVIDGAAANPATSIQVAAHTATRRFLAQLRSERVYEPDVYGERAEAQQHLAEFEHGSLPVMLLLGASGAGKTCFLASQAAAWAAEPPPSRTILLAAAATLPVDAEGLGRSLAQQLGQRGTVADVARGPGWGDAGHHRVLILLDAVDRHPDPAGLLREMERLGASFAGTAFRLVITCTPSVLEAARAGGLVLAGPLYYRATRGLLLDGDARTPGVTLGPLSEPELADAYGRYRARPGSSPATSFADLSDEARQTLANPLILRLATEVFDGRAVPARVLSGEMLSRYAERKVFAGRRRADFVAALADLMIGRRARSLPLEDLLGDPRLRDEVLDHSPASVFVQLQDDQVLSVGPGRRFECLPLPTRQDVSFTFERLFEYVLTWRVAARCADEASAAVQAIDDGRLFPPMRGAALLILVHLARSGDYTSLSRLAADADNPAAIALLADVLDDLYTGDSTGTATEGARAAPRGAAAALAVARERPELVARVVGQVGEAAFARGRWGVAHAAAASALDIPGVAPQTALRQRNRLVLLCKNMDRWDEARGHSDQCLAALDEWTPSGLVGRVHVNRGSVLYDTGDRAGAATAFGDAARAARAADEGLVLAAALNNLGVYHLYHDELDLAEQVLRDGIAAALGHSTAIAYLETNLGLVHVTRALTDPGQLQAAEVLFGRALSSFTVAGHLQGVSYALANRGVCDMLLGRAAEAGAAFARTTEIAGLLGERWTANGVRANEAIVLLRGGGDPAAAWQVACDAAEVARSMADPKGLADASLIAGRAAVCALAGGGAGRVPAGQAVQRLQEAAGIFGRLGQRLGEGQAQLCLGRVFRHQKKRGAALEAEARGRMLLGRTQLPGLGDEPLDLPWHMLLLMEVY
jgi:tetratricopeptide (TPR) repeat protein